MPNPREFFLVRLIHKSDFTSRKKNIKPIFAPTLFLYIYPYHYYNTSSEIKNYLKLYSSPLTYSSYLILKKSKRFNVARKNSIDNKS